MKTRLLVQDCNKQYNLLVVISQKMLVILRYQLIAYQIGANFTQIA